MRPLNLIINEIIDREGGYVNNPKDAGGATKYGITERTARSHKYTGEMINLPRDLAYQIYANTYYYRPGFGEVARYSPALSEMMTDAGVVCGPGKPSEWLQRLLNVLNREERTYKDIKVDGSIGHNTITALDAYLDARGKDGEEILIRGFNCLLGAHFIGCAEDRSANEEFIYGWLKNRVML